MRSCPRRSTRGSPPRSLPRWPRPRNATGWPGAAHRCPPRSRPSSAAAGGAQGPLRSWAMRAAIAVTADHAGPLSALSVGEAPEPTPPDDWVVVEVRASSLNQHDLWSLRGVGLPADRLPMVLGCDAAGIDPD